MKNENVKFKDIEGKVIFLATASKKRTPNIIAAEVNKITDDGLIIITDNQMGRTVENILTTKKAAILFTNNKKIWWRIFVDADYQTNGEWLEFVKGLETNKKWTPKGVLVLKIKEVDDLDSGQKIFEF
jgi:predicted pyridoxine 5'-phosphate oxidase superfamily flavin-nucleotide-binding protein